MQCIGQQYALLGQSLPLHCWIACGFFVPRLWQTWSKPPCHVKAIHFRGETLYVGILCVVLIIGAQELLRIQLCGDSYQPFDNLGGSTTTGRLWWYTFVRRTFNCFFVLRYFCLNKHRHTSSMILTVLDQICVSVSIPFSWPNVERSVTKN